MKLRWKASLFMAVLFSFLTVLSAAAAAAPEAKPILLEGAWDFEMSKLTSGLKDTKQQQFGGWTYTSGTLNGYPVVVCRTGDGAAQAVKNKYTRGSIVAGCINTSNCWNEQIDRILWLHRAYGASCE